MVMPACLAAALTSSASMGPDEEVRHAHTQGSDDIRRRAAGMAPQQHPVRCRGDRQRWAIIFMGWARCLPTVVYGSSMLAALGDSFGQGGGVSAVRGPPDIHATSPRHSIPGGTASGRRNSPGGCWVASQSCRSFAPSSKVSLTPTVFGY